MVMSIEIVTKEMVQDAHPYLVLLHQKNNLMILSLVLVEMGQVVLPARMKLKFTLTSSMTSTRRSGTWHQEVNDKILPDSRSSCPDSAPCWMPLRFSTVDGEDYGRGRVEEFLGDLKSLEALSQAIIEGSAAAAKVVFTVSPSATTKPQSLTECWQWCHHPGPT